MGHRAEWATGTSGPHGRVSHKEELATRRSEPFDSSDSCLQSPNPGHESLGPPAHCAPIAEIRKAGITRK